jgi:hypothetical protein
VATATAPVRRIIKRTKGDGREERYRRTVLSLLGSKPHSSIRPPTPRARREKEFSGVKSTQEKEMHRKRREQIANKKAEEEEQAWREHERAENK